MWTPIIHPMPFNADANYTLTLQEYCESAANMYGQSFNMVAPIAAPVVFDFQYPLYDGIDKTTFEVNFLRHFYLREFAYETPGSWKLHLEDAFQTWMPYYNQLFEAQAKAGGFDWLLTDSISYTRESVGDEEGTGNTRNIGTVHSDDETSTDSTTTNTSTSNAHTVNGGTVKVSTDSTTTDNGSQNSTTKNDGTSNQNTNGKTTQTTNGTTNTTGSTLHTESDTPQGTLANLENNSYLSRVTRDNSTQTATNSQTVDTDINQDVDGTTHNTSTVNASTNNTSHSVGTQTTTDNRTTDTNTETNDVSHIAGTTTGTSDSKTTSDGTSSDTRHRTSKEIYTESGRRGRGASVVSEYMESIRNILDDFYNRMDDLLFMQIW